MEIKNTLENAIFMHEAGEMVSAIAMYNALLRLDPAQPDVLTNLGVALYQQGDSAAGLQALQDAVLLDGNDPGALYNLGFALLSADLPAEAIKSLNRAEMLSPSDPDISDALDQAHQALAKSSPASFSASFPASSPGSTALSLTAAPPSLEARPATLEARPATTSSFSLLNRLPEDPPRNLGFISTKLVNSQFMNSRTSGSNEDAAIAAANSHSSAVSGSPILPHISNRRVETLPSAATQNEVVPSPENKVVPSPEDKMVPSPDRQSWGQQNRCQKGPDQEESDQKEWRQVFDHLTTLEQIFRAHGLDEEVRHIEEKRQDLMDPSVLVFIIGEGKFGKSSLINHLLGTDVAEVKKVPKTWRIDLFRSATNGAEHAKITRYTQSIRSDKPSAPSDKLSIPSEMSLAEEMSLSEAVDLCKEQEPKVLKQGVMAPGAGRGDARPELNTFEGQIIQVDWYHNNLALDERLTLVDTPGFAQPRGKISVQGNARRRAEGVAFDIDDISENFYHRSDIVLWAFKATKLEDRDTKRSIELLSREKKRVLGVITHWDRIDEPDRAGRLKVAEKLYGSYVEAFFCVDCSPNSNNANANNAGAGNTNHAVSQERLQTTFEATISDQPETGASSSVSRAYGSQNGSHQKEGIARLQKILRSEADRADAVKLQSAQDFCADRAAFGAEWLQFLGDGLVHNVAQIAMYCNEASDLLLRGVGASRMHIQGAVEEKLSAEGRLPAAESGLLRILQSHTEQDQKQNQIEKYFQVPDLNADLARRLETEGNRLSIRGSQLARQRKLQQVVIKGRGAAEYRPLEAQIDAPQAENLGVSLSGICIPSVGEGFLDVLVSLFPGSWVGNIAEFFGGRNAEERESEAFEEAALLIQGALHKQIDHACAAFTKAGAETILASANSGVAKAYPENDLSSLRLRARLIDEHGALLAAMTSAHQVAKTTSARQSLTMTSAHQTKQALQESNDTGKESSDTKTGISLPPTESSVPSANSSADFQPWCESHFILWSPVDDGRQVVLNLFCSWFDLQQAQVREEALPWGEKSLQDCPLPRSFVYACVRAMIHETKQWFGLSAPVRLSRLSSQHTPTLNVAALMEDDAWLGSVAGGIDSRDPLPEGSLFLKNVFPNLPEEAFTHFQLEGLGHAFSSKLSREFLDGCRTRFAAAPPVDAAAETARLRFSPLQRLATRSFFFGTAGAAAVAGLTALLPLVSDRPIVEPAHLFAARLYAAEFSALLHAAWAAGRAGLAVLMVQYLFFLRDKHRILLYWVTEKASQTIPRECTDAWGEVVGGLDLARAKTIASEYTLVGMRPLDYARDGLVEKYLLASK